MDNEDMINTLNNMIKSGKIPDNVKDILQNFSNSDFQNNTSNSSTENTTNNKNENTNPSINPEMLSNMLKMLGQNQENNSNTNTNTNSNSNSSNNSSIDMEMLLKMKNIMDKINSNQNDPRANLLISLKPYLKESRRNKVDQYARLFTMSKVMDLFNSNGGEMKK